MDIAMEPNLNIPNRRKFEGAVVVMMVW